MHPIQSYLQMISLYEVYKSGANFKKIYKKPNLRIFSGAESKEWLHKVRQKDLEQTFRWGSWCYNPKTNRTTIYNGNNVRILEGNTYGCKYRNTEEIPFVLDIVEKDGYTLITKGNEQILYKGTELIQPKHTGYAHCDRPSLLVNVYKYPESLKKLFPQIKDVHKIILQEHL